VSYLDDHRQVPSENIFAEKFKVKADLIDDVKLSGLVTSLI